MVTGFTTMPLSNFFTRRTCSACSSMERLRWTTPMPPAWAMAMASGASVTVSMAAEMSGMPSSIVLVSRVRVSTWEGRTSEAAGTSSTSSKVRASRMGEEGSIAAHISRLTILQDAPLRGLLRQDQEQTRDIEGVSQQRERRDDFVDDVAAGNQTRQSDGGKYHVTVKIESALETAEEHPVLDQADGECGQYAAEEPPCFAEVGFAEIDLRFTTK